MPNNVGLATVDEVYLDVQATAKANHGVVAQDQVEVSIKKITNPVVVKNNKK